MVTETSRQGWFSRLGNAFKGILAGILLVVGAVILLFWNEGRTVNRYKALKEGAQNSVEVSSDKVDAANEGRLVYMTGKAVTDETLTDADFGVAVNALKLRRSVTMFQWSEIKETRTERKAGGSEEKTTTYSYKKVWEDGVIDSASFKEPGHVNPVSMPFKSNDVAASKITVGAFTLSDSLKGAINNFTPFDPSKTSEPAVPKTESPGGETPSTETVSANGPADGSVNDLPAASDSPDLSIPAPTVTDDTAISLSVKNDSPDTAPTVTSAPVAVPSASDRKPIADGYYLGKDPNNPQIGDLRVTFSVVLPTDVSLVSQQTGETFVPYQAKNGTVELLKTAVVSRDQMFAEAQSANKTLSWILRAVGFLLAAFGFGAIFGPLAVLADVLPPVGSIVRAGTGAVAFLLAAILSLTTIAVAWFFYRPLLSAPMFAGAFLFAVFLWIKMKKRGRAKTA